MLLQKRGNYYNEINYKDGDFFMFGKESKGIDENILSDNRESCIKIPMIISMKRSLNLANSVNIILYEALRQNNFFNLK